MLNVLERNGKIRKRFEIKCAIIETLERKRVNLLEKYRQLLSPSAKVLNIYHKDLDGCASSIVVKNVFSNVYYQDVRYGFVNKLMEKINYNDYDVVLLTDISPETPEPFTYANNIFLLDHHDTASVYHNPQENRIVETSKSAAKLARDFFETLHGIDLSYLKSFCDAVNDYDLWINKNPDGWKLNELYFKYWDETFRRRFKNGDINFTTSEISYVKERQTILKEKIESLDLYEMDSVNAAFFFSTNFVNDVCHAVLSKGFDFVICINPKSKNCSVRASTNIDIHVGDLLKTIELGGGHPHAGGFMYDNNSDVERNIEKIEKYLYMNYEKIRR